MGLKIIIVGEGIAGLAAAISLRQGGHEVIVLEKRSGKKEVGQAVTVPPNATKVLKSFGMDLSAIGSSPWLGMDIVKADVEPMIWMMEQAPVDFNGTYGAPSLNTHRGDYHSALMAMAMSEKGPGPKVEIREGCSVIGYNVNGSIELEQGETLTADLIVAADGVKSMAHRWILGEERLPTLTRLSNVRFAIETETMMKDPEMAKLLAKGEGRFGLYVDSSNRMSLFRSPMRNNEVQNFGAYAIADTAEQGTKWITQTNRQIAQERVRHLNSAIARIPEHADEGGMYLWKVADRDPLPQFCENRLVLIGDACHPMQPHLGQGASQAVEDAGVLGIVMNGLEDPSEVPERLRLWQDLRMNRASAAVLLSRAERLGEWSISTEDQDKAKKYLDGAVFHSRPEVYDYFYSGDQLKEAREAVQRRFGP